MSELSESVILCEGYDDRAFWDGILKFLGCTLPQDPNRPMLAKIVKDPWGTSVRGGQFGYYSQEGEFIRVIPCHGDASVSGILKNRLQERATRLVRRLVVTYDADADARSDPEAIQGIAAARASVHTLLKALDPKATTNSAGDYELDGGKTLISVVVWWAPDNQAPGLPWKHTLERLVCAALGTAFPGRADAVEQWLQIRPAAPSAGPKEYAWSNMAGWYGDQGCEAFYKALWSEPRVAAELRSRLEKIGAWRIAQEVASGASRSF